MANLEHLDGALFRENGETMEKTLEVVFDGQVFRPDIVPDLEPNRRYTITIQSILPVARGQDAWDVLESLAGSVEAPTDWAVEHDHYLYGAPRRHDDRPV